MTTATEAFVSSAADVFAPQDDREWYAVQIRTASRVLCEQTLCNIGVEVFSPCVMMKRKWSDRTKMVVAPLFPGYIFCRFNLSRRLPILQTLGVIGIVGVGRISMPINQSELDQVRRAVDSQLAVDTISHIVLGQKLRITSGPLLGLEGVLEQIKSRTRLLISVTLLQRAVVVDIDSSNTSWELVETIIQ